jgi:HEAT repeat protein
MGDQITQLIQALRDGTGSLPARKQLETMSKLPADDQAALREAWPAIAVETRLHLLTVLADVAESDIALDFGAVFRLALEDNDEETRLAALEGLWDDDDEALAPRLIQLLNADPSVAVRAAAAMNLGRFAMLGELEEIDPNTAGLVRDALLSVIRSPVEDTEVRRRALEAVSCMAGADITDLIRAAYREKDEQMTVSAVYAMGRSLDMTWAPFVRGELKNARPEIRMEAARAAGELDLSDALPELLDMLYDPEAKVREAVIDALGSIGSERALQVLGELARSTDEAIRYAALDALEVARFNEDPLSPEVLSWLLDREAIDWDEEDEFDDEYDEDWDDEE